MDVKVDSLELTLALGPIALVQPPVLFDELDRVCAAPIFNSLPAAGIGRAWEVQRLGRPQSLEEQRRRDDDGGQS